MTKEEYYKKIDKALCLIDEGKIEELELCLDELYKYKPVSLKWIIAKARLMFEQNKIEEAWKYIGERVWPFDFYEGCDEYYQFVVEKSDYYNGERARLHYSLMTDQEYYKEKQENYKETIGRFLEQGKDELLEELFWLYFEFEETTMQGVIRCYLESQGVKVTTDVFSKDEEICNFDYLKEKINGKSESFVIIQTEENQSNCDILVHLLNNLGHRIYLISSPVLSDNISVETSFSDSSDCEDCIFIPCYKTLEGNNNLAEIIHVLYQDVIDNGYAVLLATAETFEAMFECKLVQQKIECLSQYNRTFGKKNICFGYMGDYLKYLEDLYCYDVYGKIQTWLNHDSKFDFSIVIPARNSAGTLQYTLKTCLNQDYDGSYEIIVSDNSKKDMDEVRRVVNDINDSRIRYVKTPRDLTLPKSFEFAFLQAKGDFVFSLGSDDGLCPWALRILKKTIDEHSNDDIVQWKRGYYCWSDYPGTKKDELVIPGLFDINKIRTFYQDQQTYFAKILKYTFNMYDMPTMYVNSGFRKQFINELLKKTGRILDGCNQDVNMGIVSAAIVEKVLNIDFPLSVVGISSNSLGYANSKIEEISKTDEQDRDIKESGYCGDNIGKYFTRGIEFELPQGFGESFNMHLALYRNIRMGLLPQSWKIELIDDKKMFREFFEEHVCLDDRYDRWINQARIAASYRGNEFLKWFDENIYQPNMTIKYYQGSDVLLEKNYHEGRDESGNIIYDGSKYEITNIEQAVQFITKNIANGGLRNE